MALAGSFAAQSKGGRPKLDNIKLVVGDANPDISQTIKGALASRGIRGVTTCVGSQRLYDTLDAEIVDMLVYDYDMLGADFVEVMQRIRRKALGKNPFVIIIATVKDSAVETVRRLISAGVDDLIRKPISIDRLFESIGTFVHNRKPFVVSYDYVGPTRRLARRPNEPPNELIQVPNTLRSRAVDGYSDAELQRVVDTAVRTLDNKQLESCGIEIDILSHRVVEAYGVSGGTHEDEQDVRGSLHRLQVVGEDLRKRARGTPSERVADLATMLIALTQRILQAEPGMATVEVQLLDRLGSAIRRALSVERNSIEVMKDIAETIASFTRKH